MKITYLFGAGASHTALPTVDEIPKEYEKFLEIFNNVLKSDSHSIPPIPFESYDSIHYALHGRLRSFVDHIANHSSIDTYAKKLYLQKNFDDYERYKLCLSIFLDYAQISRGPDQRYDTFFASILKENVKDFPKNVNVVSWNYDTQFETAYAGYSGQYSMSGATDSLGLVFKNNSYSDSVNLKEFNIVKLNGSLGSISKVDDTFGYLTPRSPSLKRLLNMHDVNAYVTAFESFTKGESESLISFAWEGSRRSDIIQKAVEATSDTEVVVVIGYSFPYFNRNVDRKIFDKMYGLSKVYIQDPNAESLVQPVQELCQRVNRRGAKRVEVIPFQGVSQFLIPNELE